MRSLPHGHVAAALGMLRKLGLDDLLAEGQRQRARMVALVTALVVARLLDPASKLTTARLLDGTTATSSLGTVLALGKVDEQELYDALDWLLAQQERIETALARRHLSHGTLVLYDVSSTYFEGRTCELAKFGHNRDGKSGKLQIVFGLLCAKDGCPVAIEVFDGNVADPATLANQVKKLKERFALERVVLVGDRGMITEARIEEVLKPAGLDWITTLRAPAIRSLAEAGSLQLSLFDERDLATITSPDYGRAPRRLPQSAAGGRARPQARRPAGRYRKETRRHCGPRSSRQKAAARQGQDCARDRPRHRQIQNGQTF
jgi:hypothetical protein